MSQYVRTFWNQTQRPGRWGNQDSLQPELRKQVEASSEASLQVHMFRRFMTHQVAVGMVGQ